MPTTLAELSGWTPVAAAKLTSHSYRCVGELECAGLLTVPLLNFRKLLSIGYINLIIQFLFLFLLLLAKYTLHSPTFHVLNVYITFSS